MTRLILLLASMIIFLLAIYGVCQLYDRTDRLDLAETQRAKLTNCELKVRELRRINSLAPILEQLLNPCQIDELEAGAERIRQKRNKK